MRHHMTTLWFTQPGPFQHHPVACFAIFHGIDSLAFNWLDVKASKFLQFPLQRQKRHLEFYSASANSCLHDHASQPWIFISHETLCMHLTEPSIFLCKRFILFPRFCHRLSSALLCLLFPGFYLFSAFLSEISSCLLDSSPSTSSGRRNVFPATFYTPKSKAILYPYLLIYLIHNRSRSHLVSCFFFPFFFLIFDSLIPVFCFYIHFLLFDIYHIHHYQAQAMGSRAKSRLSPSLIILPYCIIQRFFDSLERNFAFRIIVQYYAHLILSF
ncbi:hypothetical protein TWF506_005558 [Arthrobotrys conoides]|uniref:Uncharacterized protein n=1 Tax=Arthrobotrys conoides TaxID=74498 RepID=A0AAN8NPI5_9PEZI